MAGDSRIIDASASPETEDSSGKEDNPVIHKKKYGGNFKLRIIVKHINYNIPWRDGTIVLIVTSTCLLPIKTTPDREIVYERIRFCNKDLTKGTDLNYPAKETTTCRTSCF